MARRECKNSLLLELFSSTVWLGVEKGLGELGCSHAKDRVQGVGLVFVPAAKLSFPQFQDHIRVTLGDRHKRGEDRAWSQSRLVKEGGSGAEMTPSTRRSLGEVTVSAA